jgi:hypothetical protein
VELLNHKMEINDNSDGTTSVKDFNNSNPKQVKILSNHIKKQQMNKMGIKPSTKEQLKQKSKKEVEKANKNRD